MISADFYSWILRLSPFPKSALSLPKAEICQIKILKSLKQIKEEKIVWMLLKLIYGKLRII